MIERSYRGWLWSLALAGTALDQYSKYSVFKWLYYGGEGQASHEIVPGVFQFLTQFTGKSGADGLFSTLRTLSGDILPKVNRGALFGAQFLLPPDYANTFFAGISLLAAVAILYWSWRRTTTRDLPLCLALGLILAGTLGNLYDRVIFGGVRDFLYFYWIEWPVFNVADCCLVCGAGFLLAQAFLNRPVVEHSLPALAVEREVAKVQ
jgi:lipoprotein signal peptidase